MCTTPNDQNYEDDFKRGLETEKAKRKRPNILVTGYTGSGKSSLIKAILGDVVPEDAIGAGVPQTMYYSCYENDLVKIWDSKGLEVGETEKDFENETKNFMREKQDDPNVDNHIHIVWYTIQGCGARVTDCDKKLIQNIFNPDNVIVAVTKSDITKPKQKDALKKVIMETGIPEERIIFTGEDDSGRQGCMELVKLSYEMLPKAYKDAFMEAQEINKQAKINAVTEKEKKAYAIITTAVAAAAATGGFTLPVSDAPILMSQQAFMIGSLAALYGLNTEVIKTAALPFLAKVAGTLTATGLAKLIPIVGNFVNAAVAGTLTGGIGMYCKHYFEKVAIAKIKGEPTPEIPFDFNQLNTFIGQFTNLKKTEK